MNPLEVLANSGYFLKEPTDNITKAAKRGYRIRIARESDTKQLEELEKICWKGLKLGGDDIRGRLAIFPAGQWVCEIKSVVVGVMYTQRVHYTTPFMNGETTFKRQSLLHSDDGPILQLLGVAVLPEYSAMQIGSGLRDFVLQWALSLGNIARVIAMTRCSSPSPSLEAYLSKVQVGSDPTLSFHCSGGAVITGAIPNFRPADEINWGHGVLIEYDLSNGNLPERRDLPSTTIVTPAAPTLAVKATTAATTSVVPERPGPITVEELQGIVCSLLNTTPHGTADPSLFVLEPASLEAFLDTPFMDLGLDSLLIVELRALLEKRLRSAPPSASNSGISNQFELSPTVLFDYPTSRQLLAYISGEVGVSTDSADGAAVSSSPPRDRRAGICTGKTTCGRDDDDNDDNDDNDNDTNAQDDDDLFAICGMACRFPGGCNSPDAFFATLTAGTHAVQEVPAEWQWSTKSRHAALLDTQTAETFDASFFRLSAAEVQTMDPHQRLILEVGHEALAEARVLRSTPFSASCPASAASSPIRPSTTGDRRAGAATAPIVGVYVGLCNNEWVRTTAAAAVSSAHTPGSPAASVGPFTSTGTAQSSAANRLSFVLGLTGPSMTVDTACSSSLAALHTALNAIRGGDCDVALVAAADLLISEYSIQVREASNMLSSDGKNKTFDAAADGYVRGEGAGAVVVKRLSRAKADLRQAAAAAAGPRGERGTGVETGGAPILAVIRGSALNQDGRSASFTAPNGSAQRALLRSALQRSGVRGCDVAYLEAHGTGTALGDPIEWGAVRDVILSDPASDIAAGGGVGREAAVPLVVGAVKTNIGHLEGAAGMAGLIKAVQCLRHRVVPRNLHLQTLNPAMQVGGSGSGFDSGPVTGVGLVAGGSAQRTAHFPRETVPLRNPVDGSGQRLIAGVSSFGSGGTNVHVVLESYDAAPEEVLMPTAAEAVKAAEAGVQQGGLLKGSQHVEGDASTKKIAFLFAGQGLLYPQMGKELFEAEPAFRDAVLRCSEALPLLHPALVDVMYRHTGAARMSRGARVTETAEGDEVTIEHPVYSQLALFAVEVGLAALWRSRGVVPTCLSGHSLGEYAAAVTAGVLTIEDAVRVLYMRAQCFLQYGATLRSDGVMCAVRNVTEADAIAAIAQARDRSEATQAPGSDQEFGVVSIAALLHRSSIVLSGDQPSVSAVLRGLGDPTVKYLPVDFAYHSPLLVPAAQHFEQQLQQMIASGDVTFRVPSSSQSRMQFVSCLTGTCIELTRLATPEYWTEQLLSCVRFLDCAQTIYSHLGTDLFVEIGPDCTLTKLVPNCLPLLPPTSSSTVTVQSIAKGSDAMDTFGRAAAAVQSRLCGVLLGARASPSYKPVLHKWRQMGRISKLSAEDSEDDSHAFTPVRHPRSGAIGGDKGASNITNTNTTTATAAAAKLLAHKRLGEIVRASLRCALSGEAMSGLDDGTSLMALGIDSLGALAVRNSLADRLRLPHLPSTLVLKHTSVGELVRFLEAELLKSDVSGGGVLQKEAYDKTPLSISPVPSGRMGDISTASTHCPVCNCPCLTFSSAVSTCSCTTNHEDSGDWEASGGPCSRVATPDDTGDSSGIEATFPATCMQQAMLFHHISDPDLHSFIETFQWRVSGDLDVAAFHAAWVSLVKLHPALRSTFDPFAVPLPLQFVWAPEHITALAEPVHKSSWFTSHSWANDAKTHKGGDSSLSSAAVDLEARIQQAVFDHREEEFDLTSPLLLRVAVVELPKNALPNARSLVLLTIHHTLVDGISMQVLLRSLAQLYAAAVTGAEALHRMESRLRRSVASYEAFASFERTVQLTDANKGPVQYWTGLLTTGAPHSRPAMPLRLLGLSAPTIDAADGEVVRVSRVLSGSTLATLQSTAQRSSVTLASLMHTMWSILYAGCSGEDVLLYASTSSGRSAALPGVEGIVGPVINTFPVLVNTTTVNASRDGGGVDAATASSSLTVQRLLVEVHKQLVNSLEFENFPLAQIQKLAQGSTRSAAVDSEESSGSSGGQQQLFNVIFDFQTSAWDAQLLAAIAPPVDVSAVGIAGGGDGGGGVSGCEGGVAKSEPVRLHSSKLIDRIGCPLSFRVIVDDSSPLPLSDSRNDGPFIQLHATSECRIYDADVLGYVLDAFVDLLNRCADAPSSVLDASVKDVASSLPPQPTHLKTKLHAAAEAGELSTLSAVQPKAMVLPATSTAAAAGDLKVPVQLNCFSSFLENGDGTSSSAGAGTWPALISAAFSLCVSQFCTSDDACVLTLGPHGPENFFVSQHVKSSTMFQQVYADACHAHAVGSARSNSVGVDAQLTGANVCFSCTPGVSFPDSCAVALSVTINENSSSSGACGWIQSPIGSVPSEVLTGIAQSLQSLLPALCETGAPESTWLRPLCDLVATPGPVATTRPDSTVPIDLLHEPFLAIASKSTSPSSRSAPAVMSVSESGEMVEVTYSELQTACDNAATALVEHVSMAKSSSEGTCVIAVVMEKGWEQVVAVLATHRLQCAYLPMDARLWPEQRIRQVLRLSGALAVFTQPHLLHDGGSLGWMTELDIPVVSIDAWMMTALVDAAALSEVANIPRVTPDDLAYLIYTSGSTGVPKGVCCHHQGAMNTIDDLNSLFEVGSNDRVLALSSLSFDLSVYDIFGLLSAGGTVVIPNHSCVSPPDPSEWFDLVVSQQVTIWDTVPAFMELLVSHAEFTGSKLPRCLRLIYMSGDWIPVTLPNRIRAVSDNPDIRIISMGGATEAAIWSNMFELGKEGSGIPDAWASVPYGRPMRNQRMYILNERMEHCAEWVTGSIYIGGAGVAKGYYKNPERTAYQFVKHPMTGEALFRTGDLGRVRPGGLLEILGREDSQVKVNGFRIELGEIERVLTQHDKVASAALAVHSNMLCAYLVLHTTDSSTGMQGAIAEATFEELREACRVKLAEYMVPKHFMLLDEIPLSSNGKVMREKLPSPIARLVTDGDGDDCQAGDGGPGQGRRVGPKDETEAAVRGIFAKVLKLPEAAICCASSTFFELGGNSLSSIQLVFAVRECFGVALGVQELFQAPTVVGVTAVLADRLPKHLADGGDDDGDDKPPSGAGAGAVAEDKATSMMKELQLHQGTKGNVPLIMFNPAGASGLCYMHLVKELKNKVDSVPVYVLDDDVMMMGGEFRFESIQQVAAHCAPIVRQIAARHARREVLLAGWSYGGVVAVEVAKLLAPTPATAGVDNMDVEMQTEDYLEVKAVVVFDSPIRAPKQLHTTTPQKQQPQTVNSAGVALSEGKQEEQPSRPAVVGPAATTTAGTASGTAATTTAGTTDEGDEGDEGGERRAGSGIGMGGKEFDIEARTQYHFTACTDLLKAYYDRPAEPAHQPPPLQCAVCDVRPMQTDYDCGEEAARELTSGAVTRELVPGTHWTMLFDDNAPSSAAILARFLLLQEQ